MDAVKTYSVTKLDEAKTYGVGKIDSIAKATGVERVLGLAETAVEKFLPEVRDNETGRAKVPAIQMQQDVSFNTFRISLNVILNRNFYYKVFKTKKIIFLIFHRMSLLLVGSGTRYWGCYQNSGAGRQGKA